MHRLTLCVVLVSMLAGVPAAAATVTVCVDPDPPPWSYWVRDEHGNRTTKVAGASVDLLQAAFAKLKLDVRFVGELPWLRCLETVATGKVDFAMDAYFDEERAKRFAYSIHYNTLTPQVFFLSRKPPLIRERADLRRYRGCGMIGASYAHYGLKPADLDLGVNTYEGMVRKLKAGRCDYFVEELEVISGYQLLGKHYLDDHELQHAPLPDAPGPSKYLIAGKQTAAAGLLPAINGALASLIKSGEAARIWRRHAGELTYRP